MLDTHFYHQLIRKYVSHFGNIFNDITVVKYNKAHTTEIERIKVPVRYSFKEGYLYLLAQDPDKNKQVQVTLPSISFEITGIKYDKSRRLNQITKHNARLNNTVSYGQYRGVPYDIEFTVTIYSRNTDDGLQIIEQIIPIFQPEFNISVNLQTELGMVKDIPVILEGLQQEQNFEADMTKTKFTMWTLNFTMKAEFYGPIDQSKIIRTAYANTYIDPSLSTGYIVRLNLNNGNNGDYKMEDVVYQGNSINEVTAAGIVIDWKRNANTSYLRLGAVQGTFLTNQNVHSQSTNAVYNLATIDMSALKVVSQKITPNPLTANIGSDFGFTEELIEFPNIED